MSWKGRVLKNPPFRWFLDHKQLQNFSLRMKTQFLNWRSSKKRVFQIFEWFLSCCIFFSWISGFSKNPNLKSVFQPLSQVVYVFICCIWPSSMVLNPKITRKPEKKNRNMKRTKFFSRHDLLVLFSWQTCVGGTTTFRFAKRDSEAENGLPMGLTYLWYSSCFEIWWFSTFTVRKQPFFFKTRPLGLNTIWQHEFILVDTNQILY